MLDIRTIRNRSEEVQQAADQKGINFDVLELIAIDDRRRALLTISETLRAERNKRSDKIKQLMIEHRREEASAERVIAQESLEKLRTVDLELRDVGAEFERLMLLVPNFTSPTTPVGTSDKDNVEVRRTGEQPIFSFQPRNHVEIGQSLDILDLERGVKIGGSRQYVLKNNGLMLHRAVQQLALDLLIELGYTLLDVPIMVKEETLVASGFFPGHRDQTYAIQEEDKWLVGTAEVPLVSYYSGEVLDLTKPMLLGAVSPCYRSEIGSAGRDVHGLYRVHQFAKVEQVVICQADLAQAEAILEQMTANAEKLLQLLELPYRVVAVCTGDMSQKNYKQYDLETWMPSRNSYGETHSASLLLDFQTRRSRIRYRDETGQLQFAYTLNNTMVATPRILIPLLENHQQEDGSIYVPKALRPYMKGQEALR
ncbi:serine--tRNA ligase [Paenibacillus baekrokdamisoli]|uniref:Serine--tRNA ligase n=1 Tax=Paenibacillus baekrokdamisoli TaxID=1712516 RepID=A0A3G9ILX1_9BACL|nr:serine--tRNA ligase [Paenibacillus baekrokdamisoli]MBB3070597.1 seryl-tRNA synthetase [Paenibacillus baekrokdamisoli]BBH19947.1 serine--tRNA ligase [Paenibacillus baekrokdamisoli]